MTARGVSDIGLGLGELFTPAEPKPHYAEHRKRLRERAAAGGLAALPDYELLELYLTRSIPRRDVKPLAKALLAQFGGLAGVLAATSAELCRIEGVGEAVALDLALLHEARPKARRGSGRCFRSGLRPKPRTEGIDRSGPSWCST